MPATLKPMNNERDEIGRESGRISVERDIRADAPDVATVEGRQVQELLAVALHLDS
jgi:hypothetical protein